ncbi:MAG TPA: chemotaxis protein CheW [Candidatus Kapabacteria bacterium]|nr:chemotaxis protein CheW [Candidatus Kapabacteria bacterium]
MSAMDEALRAFLVESIESLAHLEEDLVTLERVPQDAATLARAFRSIHTIKGTCGFFGFNRMEQLTHAAEDVLARLRDGQMLMSRELTSALFELIDAVRHMVANIEQSGGEGEQEYAALIQVFRGFLDGKNVAAQPAPEMAAALEEVDKGAAVADSAIRVDVGLLDKLMNVVGELVLTRNQILQYAGNQSDPVLAGASQRLNLITTELQEGVMKTRMQPISTVWSAFPRLVRDLEVHTGKKVKLEREGGDTELDRSLLQAIKDPLTHLLRNAVDHGLESPQERIAAGKPETGLLRLRALHESGYVIVEITDDGAGVNFEAVLNRAISRGLVRQEQAPQMSERDILQLLFLPGFSTAEHVTNISGRGVGLDVVRNNVERVGGSVDIQTRKGSGTTFKVKIPLTLAIIPALVTTCYDERYAIPQVNLLEIVRLDSEERKSRIEPVHDSLVFRLRGKLLPLVDLREVLSLPRRSESSAVHVLVLQADSRSFGLIVDTVRDTEEIVVKPLGRHFKHVNCFAGATIMGDGRVALILDAVAIAQRAHVLTETQQATMWKQAQDVVAKSAHDRHSLLLFRIGSNAQGAIPLSSVKRLEEFPVSAIEYSCGAEVVQYRGTILPLVRVSPLLGINEAINAELLQVVVHAGDDGEIGLVVDGIVDIVDEEITTHVRKGGRAIIKGSAVIQGRVTDLLDMQKVSLLAAQQVEELINE